MGNLCTENISKSFGDRKVLEKININLNEGETVSLLGVSGGGKTTLFNIVSGLLCPDEGSVYLNGKDITGKPGEISYMLQKDLLLPYYTVLDNVSLPLTIKSGLGKKEAREKASEYFSQFGLEGTQKKYPSMLSGGMRQRAALLRTYLASDGVALLDEPFSAIDPITKSSMHKWYLDIMKQINLSTLFVTHDIDEAIFLSDRIYILAGSPGKITNEFIIDKAKVRDSSFALSAEFLDHKKKIIEAIGVN